MIQFAMLTQVLCLQSGTPAVYSALSQYATRCVFRLERNVQNLCCPAFRSQSSMLNHVSKLKAHHVILCCLQECVCVCAARLCSGGTVELIRFYSDSRLRSNLPLNFDRRSREPPGKNRYAFIMPLLFLPDSCAQLNKLVKKQTKKKKTDDGDGISGNQKKKKKKTFAFHILLPGQQPQHFSLSSASLVGSDKCDTKHLLWVPLLLQDIAGLVTRAVW